jgi:flagellar motility protein MotE (MotC chaperone)
MAKGAFLLRLLLIFLFFTSLSFSQEQKVSSTALIKQQIEIKELKKQLNFFYNKKEKEYQLRKKELETILKKIEKEKKDIQDLYSKNETILKDIKGEVESKTSKIYNKMKPKIAAGIFNQMMIEGKIEVVFDIILKLKENKVTSLMKYLSPKSASLLTQMLQDYKIDNKNEG